MQQDITKDLNLGWVPIFHELSLKLLQYKDDRKPLVKILYDISDSAGQNRQAIMDQKAKSKTKEEIIRNSIPLDDICPLTLMNFINRRMLGGNRDKILENYINFFELTQSNFNFSDLDDVDTDTIPLMPPIKIWFFPYKYERRPDDIDMLWDMFEAAINYADSNGKGRKEFIQAYDHCMRIKWTGSPKLSQVLYALRPKSYPTLESNSTGYLLDLIRKRVIKHSTLINTITHTKKYTGEEYLDITDALKDEFSDKYGKDNVFIGLSYDSYQGKIPAKKNSTQKSLGKAVFIRMYKEAQVDNDILLMNFCRDILGTYEKHGIDDQES